MWNQNSINWMCSVHYYRYHKMSISTDLDANTNLRAECATALLTEPTFWSSIASNEIYISWCGMSEQQSTVRTVVRAAEIVKLLSDGPKGVVEVANTLGLGQATVHRLLRTLDSVGIVLQDPLTRRYNLGPLLWKIGAGAYSAYDFLVLCSFDEMKRLRDLTGETVGLYVRVGTQRLLLEGLESKSHIKFAVEKGYTAPVYTGAPGRVLLAGMNDGELAAILNLLELPSVGPAAITDKSALVEEISRTRERGYAISSGEWVPGSTSISVPVKNYVCPVCLSVFGPDYRLTNPMHFVPELMASANRISDRLLSHWAPALGGEPGKERARRKEAEK